MATAQAEQIEREEPGAVPDSITGEYQALLARIMELEKESSFWEKTIKNDFFDAFLKRMTDKADTKAAAWREPSFKPKDFAEEQSRVIGIDVALKEIQEYADEKRQALTNARRSKASMEDQYPLLVGRAPATVEDMPQADENAIELHILTVPLKGKGKIALKHNLEKAGFIFVEEGENWHWSAIQTGDSLSAYDAACQGDRMIYLECWYDDPNQTKIPVEDPSAVEQAEAPAEPDLEPPDLADQGWREITVETKLLSAAIDVDLVGPLEGMGFKLGGEDNASQIWCAPYTRELFDSAKALADGEDRIIEVFRR